jgi:2,3-diketo-5-methylthio-1-phosphopentane phosphatase
MASPTRLLITDFDGTLTLRDCYEVVAERLTPPDSPDYWAEYRAGRLTHFEAIRRIFARIRCSEAEMRRTIRMMSLDPRTAEAVQALRDGGWRVVVVSAGCHWYISHLLSEANATLEVHANPGRFDPDAGLILELPTDSPYFTPETGIDKEAFVREALTRYATVAYAGDGPPDFAPACLVAPELRFARRWLAAELSAKGLPFHPFERWSEIARILLGGGVNAARHDSNS